MFFSLADTNSSWLMLLLDAALRSLLFACFVGAILAALRVRNARHQLIAWRATLVLALAMPVLLRLIPRLPLPVPLAGTALGLVSARADAPSPAGLAAPIHASTIERQLQNDRLPPGNSDSAAPAARAPARPDLRDRDRAGVRREWSWPLAGAALELAVALFFLARMGIGLYLAKRLLRCSFRIHNAEAVSLVSRICRAAGIVRPPRLGESAMVRVPVTLGIRDPMILLPSGWRAWRSDELAAVLTHEASHVARGDALIQRMALVHRAIFWFSPLAWWLERHLADLAEQASDEAALAAGADRARYAEALLGFFAELHAASTRVWWHGVAMAKAQSEKRVERILAWKPVMSNRMSTSLAVAIVAMGAPVAALTVAARPAPYRVQGRPTQAARTTPPPPSDPGPPPSAAIPEPRPAPLAVPSAPAGAPPVVAPPLVVPAPPIDPAVPNRLPSRQAPPAAAVPESPHPVPLPPIAITPPAGGSNGWGDWGWGPRFVIVSKGAEIVHGTEEDAELARALRSKIHGDFIWFERDGQPYLIRDQAIVDRAKKLWSERGDQAELQQQWQEKEHALSEELREEVQQEMREIRVNIPDLRAELEKLQSELKHLNGNTATLRQLGDVEREIGDLKQALDEARANSNVQQMTQRAGQWGRDMGALGQQIGEIAREQLAKDRQAGEQIEQLFDQAIASGSATPQ